MALSQRAFRRIFVICAVGLIAAIAGSCVACAKYVRVKPGYVGVLVDKCGNSSGKGVAPTPLLPGYHLRSLFCEEVETYPISMQNLILTKNPHEGTGGPDGKEVDQSITVNSSEGLPIETDVNLNFTLDPAKVPDIYATWRADIEHISHQYIRQTIREALATTFNMYTAEELYSTKKEIARAAAEKFLIDKLSPKGFVISQFTISRIELPQQVMDSVKAKAAMVQDAQRAQQEVVKKQAEAAQAVAVAKGHADAIAAEADGEAKAILTRAQAQAQANKILSESLTPNLIQYETVQKWSGAVPQVSGNQTAPFITLK